MVQLCNTVQYMHLVHNFERVHNGRKMFAKCLQLLGPLLSLTVSTELLCGPLVDLSNRKKMVYEKEKEENIGNYNATVISEPHKMCW